MKRFGQYPLDRGWLTAWQKQLIRYFTRKTAHRRHDEPFAKTSRGKQRRDQRRFRLREKSIQEFSYA